MGEAIAAFRKYALRAREALDAWWFDADCDNTQTDLDSPSHAYFWGQEVARNANEMCMYRYSLEEYVASLDSLRHEAEYHYPRRYPRAPANERADRFYAARVPGREALRALADEAVREAVSWGPLAERIERYCRTLLDTTESMVHGVAAHIASNKRAPADKYLHLLREWFDAFDGLSPFEGSPADKSSAAAAKKAEQEFPPRPVGMPKVNDEALERELVAGWDALGERCRRDGERLPSKEQYIEDRNRGVLKDPKRLAALNAEHFRYLETGLRARRRKRQGTRTKRR
jgi:hypothetical protein